MTEFVAIAVPVTVALVALVAIGVIVYLLRRVARNNHTVDESDSDWENRDYRCPRCSTPMQQGYAVMGKGMIWTPRHGGKIGTFAHIGQVLDNTISLRLPPALNMTWRCQHCDIVIVDHSKLIKRKK